MRKNENTNWKTIYLEMKNLLRKKLPIALHWFILNL